MKKKYKNLFDLTDKVAIVTGASKGIGASIAKAFAEFGAKVVVSSRSQDAIDKVVSEIKADGYNATACICHVGEDDQLTNLIETTINKYGKIDILVNNAGINPVFDRLENADEKLFNKILDINTKSPFKLSNLAFKYASASARVTKPSSSKSVIPPSPFSFCSVVPPTTKSLGLFAPLNAPVASLSACSKLALPAP